MTGRGLWEIVRRQALGLVRNPDIQMIRDLIYLGIGQIGVKLVGFVIYAYLARRLSTEDYGVLETILAVVGLLAFVVDFGLGAAGVRYRASHEGKPEAEAVVAVVAALRFILSLVSAALLVAGVAVFLPEPELVLLSVFLGVSLILQTWSQEWLLQSLEKMRDVALAQFLRTSALAIGVLHLMQRSPNVVWFGVAEAFSMAVAAGFMIYASARAGQRLRFGLPRSVLGPMVRLATPLGLNALLWGAAQSLPVVIVGSLAGLESAAYFAASQRLVTSLQSLSYIYHFNMYPALTRSFVERPEAMIRLTLASFRVVAWACIGPAIFVAAHGGAAMALVYGEAFRASGPIISVLFFAIPIQLLSGHHRWALAAAGRGGAVLATGIAGAATAVPGCLLLTPTFGTVGASWAVVGSTLAIWIVAIVQCNRAGLPIPTLNLLVRPVAAGCGATLAAGFVPLGAASGLIAFVTIYLAIGLIVDQSRIYADLRFLAYSKKTRRADVNMVD